MSNNVQIYVTPEEKEVLALLRRTVNEAQIKNDVRVLTIMTDGAHWNFGIAVQKSIKNLRELNGHRQALD